MAELSGPESRNELPPRQSLDGAPAARNPIPAHVQLLAVAWLRWRIFVNGFRRRGKRNNASGLVFSILVRVVLWPIFALWGLGPIVACAALAWSAVADHHPELLLELLTGIALLWQFIAINGLGMAANMSSFDPASLLRFPLRFDRYLLLRTLLGLMTMTTVVGSLGLLAAAIAIAVADSGLALAAFVALGLFALANIFFARMVGAWLERWLASRRFREIFGVGMALFFVCFEFLNVRRGPGHGHAAANGWLLNVVHASGHAMQWLPPGFAAKAVLGHAQLLNLAGLLAWAALFAAAFGLRLRKQFLGEFLSEGAPRATPAAARHVASRPIAAVSGQTKPAATQPPSFFSPTVAACLRKEWLYVRGNSNQIMAMLTPLLFVFILSRSLFANHPNYILPGSLGYAVFGLLAGLYNIFGADAAGVQLYLLAPVRLRDVVLAKNIASLALLSVEAVAAWGLALALARTPVPLSTQVSAGFWIVFVIASNLALGTLRSIQAPHRFVPGQPRQMRTPTNRTSSLLVLALLFGSIALQVPTTLLCRHFHQPWLGAAIFAPLALAAIAAYVLLLANADAVILRYRDLFAEELCAI